MKRIWLALALLTAAPQAHAANRHHKSETTTDVTARYLDHDLSPLLMPHTAFLGFAGGNYQRLRVVFLSVAPVTPSTYAVTGFTLYKGRQTPFSGKLKPEKIARLKTWTYGTDDEMKGRVRDEAALFATYDFRQPDGATLTGRMEVDFYVDLKGRLIYGDLDGDQDGYCNNQYRGVWTTGNATVTANWGEYRVPDSGDLDDGAAEFHAAAKYAAFGWPAEESAQ